MAKELTKVQGFFSGIDDAEKRAGGTYLQPGAGDCRVVECKAIETRQKRKAFVVEVEITAVTDGANRMGARLSWMVMMDSDSALSDIKGFAAAATGAEFGSVDEAAMMRVVSPEQPLRNRRLRFAAQNVKTKGGSDFTRVEWELHPEEKPLGAKGAPAPAKR